LQKILVSPLSGQKLGNGPLFFRVINKHENVFDSAAFLQTGYVLKGQIYDLDEWRTPFLSDGVFSQLIQPRAGVGLPRYLLPSIGDRSQ
jgi:hypothetical protein